MLETILRAGSDLAIRTIFDPTNGNNVTSTVQALLQAGRTLVTSYLYRWEFMNMFSYNPYSNQSSYVFTDATFPIFVEYYQLGPGAAQQIGIYDRPGGSTVGLTFLPEAMNVNKLLYGVGLQDHPVDVTWNIKDSMSYGALVNTGGVGETYPEDSQSPNNLTLKQALCMGLFTECPFWIHQAIFSDFPRNGGSFLGTALMFRGFIRSVTANRSKIKITLASLMDVFQQVQVPTQTLTPNNRALPYIPAASSAYGGDFSVLVINGPQEISFTTAETIPQNAMQDSWMTFLPATFAANPVFLNGQPPAIAFRIQSNTASSGGHVTLFFYEPIQIPPGAVLFNFYSQLTTQGGNQGFAHLPPPEYSA